VPDARSLRELAASRGVLVLDSASAWAAAQQRRACLVARAEALSGAHLPVSRVIFYELPERRELAPQLCGRTARLQLCAEALVLFRCDCAARWALGGPARARARLQIERSSK
jgi:hypothetical protein